MVLTVSGAVVVVEVVVVTTVVVTVVVVVVAEEEEQLMMVVVEVALALLLAPSSKHVFVAVSELVVVLVLLLLVVVLMVGVLVEEGQLAAFPLFSCVVVVVALLPIPSWVVGSWIVVPAQVTFDGSCSYEAASREGSVRMISDGVRTRICWSAGLLASNRLGVWDRCGL